MTHARSRPADEAPGSDDPTLTRRSWLRRTVRGGVALMVGSGLYAWRIEPFWVQVTRQAMPLRGLPDRLVGKRLVQVSDLHIGPVVDNGYLRAALNRLADLEPDYLVITGDFLTCRGREQTELAKQTLREAPIADVPTFAILGNHDYGEGFRRVDVADHLTDELDAMGVRVLRNDSAEVDGLQVAGSDELWAQRCDVFHSMRNVDHQRPTVYLAHNPDIADVSGWTTFNGWILSGHTHGGQCRFPLLGAPVLPIRNRRYAEGRVSLSGGRTLYVNRGLGYKKQLRFGVRPEVTVFTLQRA